MFKCILTQHKRVFSVVAHFEKKKQEADCKRTSGISTLGSSSRRGQADCTEPVLLCLLPSPLKSGCFSLLPVKFCMRLSKHLHMFAAAEYLCRCLSASVADCNQGNVLKRNTVSEVVCMRRSLFSFSKQNRMSGMPLLVCRQIHNVYKCQLFTFFLCADLRVTSVG